MKWAGSGTELWRVRVDVFAPDDRGRRVDRIAPELARHLVDGDGDGDGDIGVDQGTGIAGRPVIGMLFWVRGDDVGAAAVQAVATAQQAVVGAFGSQWPLYDVIVIPRAAVALPGDPGYPRLPD